MHARAHLNVQLRLAFLDNILCGCAAAEGRQARGHSRARPQRLVNFGGSLELDAGGGRLDGGCPRRRCDGNPVRTLLLLPALRGTPRGCQSNERIAV